jgi:hypothetical protein
VTPVKDRALMTTKIKKMLPPLLPSTFARLFLSGRNREATVMFESQLRDKPRLEAAGIA